MAACAGAGGLARRISAREEQNMEEKKNVSIVGEKEREDSGSSKSKAEDSQFLDEGYFGPNENQDHPIRLGLLSGPQREAMDALVARKLDESKDKRIVNWESEDALAEAGKLLI
ncbi:phosphotransferase [Apiospora saccharicola]